ncbi:hypothetical protein DP113_32845 (plasmid) [Brasilonema octagenarum UFV-E1]|uniref:Helicase/UvrB N-terminal domain-containing protein n=2 Tax=Brasilonema TaxID=383614 RepID=A0A856MSD6_9CYAN|nr:MULTISPECIES: DEAD/DEAH box helicase family protein [Brasilonema]NMF64631.1 hypothetical protein [Brasilonema octagenarum UFV-OR1]QDL12547.1 hypothetical protein DP114_32745 [Brasilonema sennae CENA114]QDL18941.1 hypothetical protein DP113_32845 [Brasilonema octagenarum UFV-E1]
MIQVLVPEILSEFKPEFKLRDYQERAIAQIHEFFKSRLISVLLYAPTGAGKTAMSSQIIRSTIITSKT